MNREILEPSILLTTKLLIHPNQFLTFKISHFEYDDVDEIEVSNKNLKL